MKSGGKIVLKIKFIQFLIINDRVIVPSNSIDLTRVSVNLFM